MNKVVVKKVGPDVGAPAKVVSDDEPIHKVRLVGRARKLESLWMQCTSSARGQYERCCRM